MRHQTGQTSIASRQERAAGRILDDEGLRGDLADDEYQPFQDWALAETDRIAASTQGVPDAKADALIDRKLTVLREIIRAAGAAIVAHAEGDAERRASALAFVGERWNAARACAALARRLDAQPDLTGPEIATHIVEALESSASKSRPERRPEQRP